ncbi:SDR family NAD(P)-dependent oxidoreductase [Sphingomonas sp. BK580]|uniref:SDR family NAD(P)-dependent oxidoreductase n=1 Tax=Sphingomonas sp. BK580 TaxID=2586972 RepID=UPI0016099D43|nr:SDR family oxidoreductase [Sphingomonas sp. BK580]MBB3695263.1 NAD(P)-dependent dehydrogenase (short-subunit alcohol dehydrogenase family) [Sphingomonas sp. BK580]
MNNEKRIAIVTGGSRGLGRSTVLALAARGIDSIFTYNSAVDEANKVVAAVEAAGARAIALQLDTGSVGSFDAFVGEVRRAMTSLGAERFDYLVNNAGMSDHTKFAELTEAVLDRIYAVNFKGVVFLTQKLLPILKDGGRIINISTGLTRFTTPDTIPYASLKGAIDVFTLYMAKELGRRGITVNTVAPGAIQTDFSGGTVRDNPAVNKHVASLTALGRPGVPDDIGPLVASLLSEDARWVTGQRIEASGGMNL